MIKLNKYDLEQVERDFNYYKNRDNSSDASIYFMLVERYRMRMQIADNKLQEALKEQTNGGKEQWKENYTLNITKEANK